jgi:hypothetical protein
MKINDTEVVKVKASQLIKLLMLNVEDRQPTHIWGATGIGKSVITRELAKTIDYQFLDFRASTRDTTDLMGLPKTDGDMTRWVPPSFLPREGKGIFFMDELTSATPLMQAACYQLVLDRSIGEYFLPEEWVVFAAGNPPSERGVSFSMPRPLRNRFAHFELVFDHEDWRTWCGVAGIEPEVVAFDRLRPQFMDDVDPASNAYSSATPRSMEFMSKKLSQAKRHGLPYDNLMLSQFCSCVGVPAGTEFFNFLQMYTSLPSVTEILRDPLKARISDEVSFSIAISTALGRVITDKNISAAVAYLDRMEPEYKVFALHDAANRDKSITSTKEYVESCIDNQKLMA